MNLFVLRSLICLTPPCAPGYHTHEWRYSLPSRWPAPHHVSSSDQEKYAGKRAPQRAGMVESGVGAPAEMGL